MLLHRKTRQELGALGEILLNATRETHARTQAHTSARAQTPRTCTHARLACHHPKRPLARGRGRRRRRHRKGAPPKWREWPRRCLGPSERKQWTQGPSPLPFAGATPPAPPVRHAPLPGSRSPFPFLVPSAFPAFSIFALKGHARSVNAMIRLRSYDRSRTRPRERGRGWGGAREGRNGQRGLWNRPDPCSPMV